MKKTNKRKIDARVFALKGMHNYMIEADNEELYLAWTRNYVPDCPCEEDYEIIAENDDFWDDACRAFARLASNA